MGGEAFLNGADEKLLIEYNGKDVQCNSIVKEQIPVELLPTAGEYMDAEEDEFVEETSEKITPNVIKGKGSIEQYTARN